MQTHVLNWFQIHHHPLPSIYSKSEYGLAFVARACTVWNSRIILSLCCCLSNSTSLAPSVRLGSFFACTLLMQCSSRMDFSWSLIPSDLKVVHSVMYDDCQCHFGTVATRRAEHLVHHLIVNKQPVLFTTGFSLQGVLPFSVCFLFFVFWICFPFSLRCLFFLFFAGGLLLLKPNRSSDLL